MAEAYANKLAGEAIAESAGIAADTQTNSGHPIPDVITAMQEDGIDIAKCTSRQLQEPLVAHFQTIIVLCKKSDCPAYITQRSNVLYNEFADPYYTDLPGIRQIRDNIKQFVAGLVAQN